MLGLTCGAISAAGSANNSTVEILLIIIIALLFASGTLIIEILLKLLIGEIETCSICHMHLEAA